MSLIITILIFGFIILIHEWGHFIVARKSGVFVEEFAIGMGKKLWSITKNGTMYSIRLFPLGGYCKMKDEDTTSNDKDSFSNASMPKKFAIIFAGAFMNFVLALVIFIGVSFFTLDTTTTIKNVTDNYPAKLAGIMKGDKIVAVDDDKIRIFEDLSFKFMRAKPDDKKGFDITVNRNGELITFKGVVPKLNESVGRELIGIEPNFKAGIFSKEKDIPKSSIFDSVKNGYWQMIFNIKATIIGFTDLITGKVDLNQLMGPIGLAPVIDNQYDVAMEQGVFVTILTMLNMMALLSANIGVLNLLPIPALDGGRIVFLTIEAIRGKPISPEKEGIVHMIGFVILMGLGILVAFKDIFNII